jgi:hypothetical protein
VITASYELNNIWHGLGVVGHVFLAVVGAVILVAVLAWASTR